MFVKLKTSNGNISLNTDFIFGVQPVDDNRTVVKINLSNKPETYIVDTGYDELVDILNDKPRIYSVIEPKSCVENKPSVDIDKELEEEAKEEAKVEPVKSSRTSKGSK